MVAVPLTINTSVTPDLFLLLSIWQSWMPVCCSVLFQSICSLLMSFVHLGKMGVRPLGGEGGGGGGGG